MSGDLFLLGPLNLGPMGHDADYGRQATHLEPCGFKARVAEVVLIA